MGWIALENFAEERVCFGVLMGVEFDLPDLIVGLSLNGLKLNGALRTPRRLRRFVCCMART